MRRILVLILALLLILSSIEALSLIIEAKKPCDVFNSDGNYLDNFYLPLHQKIKLSELVHYPLIIQGDILLVIEKDDSGNIFLVK